VLLSAKIIKLASITQNNHVYEYTAEGLTLKVLLNIRSPYRRQKRDLSIIRSSFRRFLYTGIEILAINIITFLPTISIISYFLPSYLLIISLISSYLFATVSTIYYLLTFLRPHRLFTIFLLSCDHIDYFLFSYFFALRSYRLSYLSYDHIDYFLLFYFFAIISTTSYLSTFLRLYRLPTTDIHIVDLSKTTHTRLVNQNRARFAMSRHGKLSS
jgi:hypothetical protein